MSSPALPPLHPTTVLCVAAHADDIEVFMGGTAATYAAQGARVCFLILTDGSKGGASNASEVPATRRREQQAAAACLGIQDVLFGDYVDSELALTKDLKRDIVQAIRQIKPDVVMCIDPGMMYSVTWGMINHLDHRIAGEAVLAAVYPLACNPQAFPELIAAGNTPHRVNTLLLANCDTHNFVVDISDQMDAKLTAMHAHTSQASSLEPLFSKVRVTAEQLGSRAGARYAEAFTRLDIVV